MFPFWLRKWADIQLPLPPPTSATMRAVVRDWSGRRCYTPRSARSARARFNHDSSLLCLPQFAGTMRVLRTAYKSLCQLWRTLLCMTMAPPHPERSNYCTWIDLMRAIAKNAIVCICRRSAGRVQCIMERMQTGVGFFFRLGCWMASHVQRPNGWLDIANYTTYLF